jgi:hypothetical protein
MKLFLNLKITRKTMNNAMIFKSVSLGVILSLSSTASVLADSKPVVLRGEPTVKHYVVHALGDAVGAIAAVTTGAAIVGTGALVGSTVGSDAGMAMGALCIPAGLMAGLYIYYKTPEWTDTHLLERGNGRTTGQNIITMWTRMVLPLWPLGVVAGEYLVYEDDVNGKN